MAGKVMESSDGKANGRPTPPNPVARDLVEGRKAQIVWPWCATPICAAAVVSPMLPPPC